MMLTNYVNPILRDPFDLQIDRLFDNAFRSVGRVTPSHMLPWNVYEQDDWFWVDAAVPGLTAKDVDLTITDGVLTMAVPQVKHEGDDDRRAYFVREIGWDAMTRSMRLPDYVDADKATASCKDGILSVGFPKRAEALAKQIPIEDKQAA